MTRRRRVGEGIKDWSTRRRPPLPFGLRRDYGAAGELCELERREGGIENGRGGEGKKTFLLIVWIPDKNIRERRMFLSYPYL